MSELHRRAAVRPARAKLDHAGGYEHAQQQFLRPRGLTTIAPAFGIGQRAILARTPAGNVLWDCLALIMPQSIW